LSYFATERPSSARHHARVSLDQDRIAELVRTVAARAQFVVHAAQRRVVRERGFPRPEK
jgi:hypothetical protein